MPVGVRQDSYALKIIYFDEEITHLLFAVLLGKYSDASCTTD